ncbi:MAG: SRPBCC domain-containing protein [Pseudomonadota bacterium]
MKDATMTEMTLRKTIYLEAAPEVVWAFLTKAEKLGAWFHPAAADLRPGEDYSLVGADGGAICWGRVTAMEPHSRLAYTFTVKPLDGHMTDVEWTLSKAAGGTRLSLVHSGLPEDERGYGLVRALDVGWDEHLGKLRAV